MTPRQFLSPNPTARIEPADFVAHFLAQRGLDADSVGLRQSVMVSLLPALERRLLRALGTPDPQPHPIQHQALYHPDGYPFSVIASPMGAPMAVMLLEQLIALGARRLLYLGFCGALAPSYRIGDVFLPTQAVREESTSYHYLPADVLPCASPHVQALLHTQAERLKLPVRQGPIWATDALYRETPHKIRQLQAAGVHAVDIRCEELEKVPYLDVSGLGERFPLLHPFFDGQAWHHWTPGPEGSLIQAAIVDFTVGQYVAKEPASPDKGRQFRFFELVHSSMRIEALVSRLVRGPYAWRVLYCAEEPLHDSQGK